MTGLAPALHLLLRHLIPCSFEIDDALVAVEGRGAVQPASLICRPGLVRPSLRIRTSMPPPEKPRLSVEERRTRHADRLAPIRLRMAIGQELDDRGITTHAAIGEVLGMPAAEAIKVLSRHQWRQGDVPRLKAAAARLGLTTKAEGGT
jgi:hypothetical protein